MLPRLRSFSVVAATVLTVLAPTTTAQAATFVASADARVSEKSPSKAYGASALRTDGGTGGREESYLRFNVTGAASGVASAKLWMYASTASVDGPELYSVSSTSWSESGMTWNNRAARASAAAAFRGNTPAGWVEWDVTNLVKGDGVVSFALAQTSTDGTDFHSREQTNKPQLVVTPATVSAAPTGVAITSPSAGASVTGSFSVTATANDTDLRAVDVYVDGTYKGYDITTPFQYQLDATTLSTGPHELKVRAYDAAGNETWSPAVTINVGTAVVPSGAPTGVAVTSPSAGATVAGPFSVTATANDSDLRAVDVYVDGAYKGYDIAAPFQYQLDASTLSAGSHELKVRAYDAAGNETWSPAVSINVGSTGSTTPTQPTTPTTGTGTTYYLDPAGSDSANGTSSSTPWNSLWKASNAALMPGDTLLLKRGASWTGALTISRHGTSSAPINIGAYGSGANPVVRGASSCLILSGSNIRVTGVTTDGCGWAGIDMSGDYNTVERVESSNNVAGVHVRQGADYNRILSSALRDNNKMSVNTDGWAMGYNCDAVPKPRPCDDDSGAFAVVLAGNHTEVAYNTISGSDTWSYDYGRDGAAVEIFGASYTNVHHNLAYDDDVFTELGKDRNDPDGSQGNTFAYNSFTASGQHSAFVVTRGAGSGWGPIYSTTLINNTAYLTGSDSKGVICHDGCGTGVLTMRNNIVRAVKQALYADVAFTDSHNLFMGPINSPSWAGTSIYQTATYNPGFADVASGNFRLTYGSVAVDRGTTTSYTTDLDNKTTPRDGNGDGTSVTDLGAYEL